MLFIYYLFSLTRLWDPWSQTFSPLYHYKCFSEKDKRRQSHRACASEPGRPGLEVPLCYLEPAPWSGQVAETLRASFSHLWNATKGCWLSEPLKGSVSCRTAWDMVHSRQCIARGCHYSHCGSPAEELEPWGSSPSRGSQAQEVHKVKRKTSSQRCPLMLSCTLCRMEQNFVFGLASSLNLIDALYAIFIKCKQ